MPTILELEKWLEPEFVSEIQDTYIFGESKSGSEAFFIMKDGDVYAMGSNGSGCLGLGLQDEALQPKKVYSLCKKNIKTLAYGFEVNDDAEVISRHVLALTEEGRVYSWGDNDYGQLGNGTTTKGFLPSLVTDVLTDKEVVQIACESRHSVVLTQDGEVYAWGGNNYGQIGTGSEDDQLIPIRVSGELDGRIATQIACGDWFTMCVLDTGEVYGWGRNDCGQLGVGNNSDQSSPCMVLMENVSVRQISCGYTYTLALSDEGVVYAWGRNSYGQLGVGHKVDLCAPAVVIADDIGRVIEVAASSDMSACLTQSNEVYIWGYCLSQHVITPKKTSCSFACSLFKDFANTKDNLVPMTLDVVKTFSIDSNLTNAFNDPETSDLQFRVEEKIIYVHKAILKIKCKHFRAMLQEHWSENETQVIDISQYSYCVYKAFLNYLYTDEVDLPAEEALDLLTLADSYCDAQLKRKCEYAVKQGITVENSARLYTAAIKYQAKELEYFCFGFAINHLEEFTKTEGFESLDEMTAKSFISKAADSKAFKH